MKRGRGNGRGDLGRNRRVEDEPDKGVRPISAERKIKEKNRGERVCGLAGLVGWAAPSRVGPVAALSPFFV
jgi:hypothetical protein